jgi:hypothetical protein
MGNTPRGPPGGFESNRLPFMCVFVRVGLTSAIREVFHIRTSPYAFDIPIAMLRAT